MLGTLIGNFKRYAINSRRTNAFDLMICAICCGAHDLAKEMWRQCSSPLRAALLAQDFLRQIEARRFQVETSDDLMWFFQDAAIGVLEGLSGPMRFAVLINVPRPIVNDNLWNGVETLGMPVRSTSNAWGSRWGSWLSGCLLCSYHAADGHYRSRSILDVAIQLENKDFIAHAYCQSILDELWNGRSAKCGMVRLRGQPQVLVGDLFLQVILLWTLLPVQLLLWLVAKAFAKALQLGSCALRAETDNSFDVMAYVTIVPQLISTTPNDLYDWPMSGGEPVESVGVVSEVLQLFHIPLFKRAVFLISHILFAFLFVSVAFQPLCGPLNVSHYVFGCWLASIAIHQGFHLIARHQQGWWKGRPYIRIELAATCLLFGASGLRISLSDLPTDTNATVGIDKSINGCPYEHPQMEALRVLLAVSTILIAISCAEIFFITGRAKSGVLMLCAQAMCAEMVTTWLPPMLLVTCSFGLGLNILAPDYLESRETNTWSMFHWSVSREFTLNLAVDGTFFAPFWGIFDMWYSPDALVNMHHGSLITPIFTWFYLLVSLVLFVNILIAMFNAKYAEVMTKADANHRMSSCTHLGAYIATYAVPPPFTIIALLFHGLRRVPGALHSCMHRLMVACAACGQPKVSERSSTTRRNQAWIDRKDRHYPLRMHLPDSEAEAFLVQARNLFVQKKKFNAWRADERNARRFDQIEATLKDHEVSALLDSAHITSMSGWHAEGGGGGGGGNGR